MRVTEIPGHTLFPINGACLGFACAYAYTADPTLSDAYTNNGLNQVTTVDATAITYDGRGNITSDGTTSWSFDASNRLTGSGSSTFAYDPSGRLERVTTGAAAQAFLYAGAQVIGDYDAAGTLVRRHVPGAALDEYAGYYLGAGTGSRRFSYYDPLGSAVVFTTEAGSPGVRYAYDEYGMSQAMTGAVFGYAGALYTPQAGGAPWSMRNRQYHPGLGRFLQADPIGVSGGMNLYGYVGNDPVNFVDPWGLCGVPGEPVCTISGVEVIGLRCPARSLCTDHEISLFLRSYLNDYGTYPREPTIVVRNGVVEIVELTAQERRCGSDEVLAGGFATAFDWTGVGLVARLHLRGVLPFPGPGDGLIPFLLGIPNYGVSREGVWVIRPGARLTAALVYGSWGIGPNGERFHRPTFENNLNMGDGDAGRTRQQDCQ